MVLKSFALLLGCTVFFEYMYIEFIPFFFNVHVGWPMLLHVMSWVTISVGACILLPLQLTLTHQANTSIAA